MWRFLTRRSGRSRDGIVVIALAFPLVLILAAGCHWKYSLAEKVTNPGHCPVIEPGAIPAPVGTYQNELQRRQASKAEADDFVVYHYEFNEEGNQFGPAGARHMIQMAGRLKDGQPFPVVIEATGVEPVDRSRWELVVSRLLAEGVVDADKRVTIGLSAAEGLYGDEAPRIYGSLIRVGNYGFLTSGGYGAYGGGGYGYGAYGGGYGGYGYGGFGGYGGGFSGGFGFTGAFGGYGFGR